MVQGTIRGLGDFYKDGTERIEIHIDKKFNRELPNRDGYRVATTLVIGRNTYESGIRSTARNSYIWICPDLKTHDGQRTNLGHIFSELGIKKNEKINLSVEGTELKLLTK